MKILVAGDSFKGSLSAKQFTDGVSDVLSQHGFSCVSLPLCDGGEGTAEILTGIFNGKPLKVTVSDALLRPVTATVGMCGETFVAESAQAVGLAQIKKTGRTFLFLFRGWGNVAFLRGKGSKTHCADAGRHCLQRRRSGHAVRLGRKIFPKRRQRIFASFGQFVRNCPMRFEQGDTVYATDESNGAVRCGQSSVG